MSTRILLAAFLASALQSQPPILLKDINTEPTGQMLDLGSDFEPLGVAPTTPPTLYFAATTQAAGRELWATQGTPATTEMVADWNPGPASSNPGPITVLTDGTILLLMDHPDRGREVHRLTGTEGGTLELGPEAVPGREGFQDALFIPFDNGVQVLGHVPASNGKSDLVWWRTDGRTCQVLGRFDAVDRAPIFAVVDSGLPISHPVFAALSDGSGAAIHRSDGTAAGTAIVPGSRRLDPQELAFHGGKPYFVGDFPGAGTEIGVVDGGNVSLADDIYPGATGSDPSDFIVFGGDLFFVASDPTVGRELRRVTDIGIELVFDLNAGAGDGDVRNLAASEHRLYFTGDDGQTEGSLYVYDQFGNVEKVFTPDTPGSIDNVTTVGDGCAFTADTARFGQELFYSDGTANGTGILTDLMPGVDPANIHDLTVVGNQLFFGGDSPGRPDEIFELVPPGTPRPLVDANPPFVQNQGSGARDFTTVFGKTYFGATNGPDGFELWVTDGSEQGTVQVTDIHPGRTSSAIADIRELGDRLVMTATDFLTVGNELFVLEDFSGEGEPIPIDINPGRAGSFPREIAGPFSVRGSRKPVVFFEALSEPFGREPWVSDGTREGTVMLRDIHPDGDSIVRDFTLIDGGLVLFNAFEPTIGAELYATDGTPGGTRLVREINPITGSVPKWFATLHGVAMFQAWGANGVELWRSDGSSAGTREVKDIHPTGGSYPRYLETLGDYVYFSARTNPYGEELWRSNGTAAGTELFADILAGTTSSFPKEMVTAGRNLFFVARDIAANERLYVTDGVNGVRLIPGVLSPRRLTAVGDRVYFSAGFDLELFVSDGTPEGTRRVVRYEGAPGVVGVREIRFSNGNVFVAVENGVTGVEPHVIRQPGASVETRGTPCGPDGESPTIGGTAGVLGGEITVTGRSKPTGTLGVLFGGTSMTEPLQAPLAECLFRLNPTSMFPIFQLTDMFRRTWALDIAVPNRPAFVGLGFGLWAVHVDPVTGKIWTTNALEFELGR